MSDRSTQAGTQDLSSLEPLGAGPTRTHAVEHLPTHGRFRLLVDDREVAVLDYRRLPGTWNIVHTYTEPVSRGYGVASDLVRAVLDTARADGVKIIPTCPYVAWWIYEYQPGYEDLVADA
jgi:predicted GNAT family acetyltransferase